MSSLVPPVMLKGSRMETGRFKLCGLCNQLRAPERGVEVAGRFRCAGCYQKTLMPRKGRR